MCIPGCRKGCVSFGRSPWWVHGHVPTVGSVLHTGTPRVIPREKVLTRLDCVLWGMRPCTPLGSRKGSKKSPFSDISWPQKPSSQPNRWPNPILSQNGIKWLKLTDFEGPGQMYALRAIKSAIFCQKIMKNHEKRPLDLVVLARFRPILLQPDGARFLGRFSVQHKSPYIQASRKVENTYGISDRPIQRPPQNWWPGWGFSVRISSPGSESVTLGSENDSFLVIFRDFLKKREKTRQFMADFEQNGHKWPF